MRTLILALGLVCGAAQAADVTMGPSDCGITKQCIAIPNDAAIDLHLYGAPNYPFFYLYIDGVPYKAAVASGNGGTNVLLTDANGDVAYLTYTFSTYTTCIRSGRGQHCSTHWSLNSGSVLSR